MIRYQGKSWCEVVFKKTCEDRGLSYARRSSYRYDRLKIDHRFEAEAGFLRGR